MTQKNYRLIIISFLIPFIVALDCNGTKKVNCSELKLEFLTDIWPIFEDHCLSCHNDESSGFPLVASNIPGAGDINFDRIMRYEGNLLEYATNENGAHEGGEVFPSISAEESTLDIFLGDVYNCKDDTVLQF